MSEGASHYFHGEKVATGKGCQRPINIILHASVSISPQNDVIFPSTFRKFSD